MVRWGWWGVVLILRGVDKILTRTYQAECFRIGRSRRDRAEIEVINTRGLYRLERLICSLGAEGFIEIRQNGAEWRGKR